jgi:hypothetical protein
MISQILNFQNTAYRVTKLLGKGKSAWSWLCENDGHKIVLKQMHDEPCPYYAFSDKLESELTAYQQLKGLKLPIPEILGIDEDKNWVFKEYIHGRTAAQKIANGLLDQNVFEQLFHFSKITRSAGFNPDFFPTNFIITCSKLYYIDYELNPYDENWNLENWGIYYWVNQDGMKKFLETGDGKFINKNPEKGIPIKEGLTSKIAELIQIFES